MFGLYFDEESSASFNTNALPSKDRGDSDEQERRGISWISHLPALANDCNRLGQSRGQTPRKKILLGKHDPILGYPLSNRGGGTGTVEASGGPTYRARGILSPAARCTDPSKRS